MSGSSFEPRGPVGRVVNGIEENGIALILGLMTVITFINVPIRYLFNGVILPRVEFLWAVEITGFLFAWLVIFGMSYCVKVGANLGVDALVAIFPRPVRRVMGFVSVAVCICYAALFLKGSWDYWAPFANLPPTTGHWFPTGVVDRFLPQGWYEVNDIPMPDAMRFLEGWFNEGEEYEKVPRVLPYLILPLGFALLLFRFVQAGIRLMRGEIENVIAGHEAEDLVEDAAARADKEG